MFMRPIPSMFKELFTAEIGFLYSFFSQFTHNLSFRGNTGMVGSRHPTGILALHAGTTHKNILNSIVKHVPHVKYPCYVWWWDNYRVGLAPIRFAAEQFVIEPVFIPF